MALIYSRNIPDGVVDATRDTLSELAAAPSARGGAGPLSAAVVSHTPLPVYALRLDALARAARPEDAGLGDAEPESWRVFIRDERNEPAGVADVAAPTGGRAARFLALTRGPQVSSSGTILTEADEGPILGSRRFQPAFLEIPGLQVSAVWLKALDGQGDAIIPIEPVPRFLSDHPTYTLQEFFERTHACALQRLGFDNTPKPDAAGPAPGSIARGV